MTTIDIEDLNIKYDKVISKEFVFPTEEDCEKYRDLINDIILYSRNTITQHSKKIDIHALKRKYKCNEKNSFLYHIFQMLREKYTNEDELYIKKVLQIKKGKSHSGVLVITIFTSPYPEYYDEVTGKKVKQSFSCNWSCSYCPNEPGQPRSYLKGEPGVLRANKYGFDCVRQMWGRMDTLAAIGHPVDKLEVLVLGGTWTSYPIEYREEFCRDMYFAANTFGDKDVRSRLSLHDEKHINKTARCKVIGLTLETRPDTITVDEIRRFRMYGCTRVQLGIQHIDDDVLNYINRKCPTEKTIRAISLLKDCGYKIDAHWMPNLPGSTYEKDKHMFMDVLLNSNIPKHYRDKDIEYEEYALIHPELQVDQWKVYPCSTVPWTDIEKWYKEGSYIPYQKDKLLDVVVELKSMIFPWIRLNRIIRDIPSDYIMDECDTPNMRDEAKNTLEREGKRCRCIRCREVKSKDINEDTFHVMVRKYNASNGIEYFISAEDKHDETLYGFVRLRISDSSVSQYHNIFPELTGCSFIRELHVYGDLQKVNKKNICTAVQHKGIGKMLIRVAEDISRNQHQIKKIAIIAGEGVKGYYEKLGYYEDSGMGSYMIKCM